MLAETAARDMTAAGVGKDFAAAVRPAYWRVKGKTVALVASTTIGHAAAREGPGANLVNFNDSNIVRANLTAIKEADAKAEIVIVYQHWQNMQNVPIKQMDWARQVVDAGADLYISHGSPKSSGIAFHKQCPLLLGLGNFFFHTKTDRGHYEADVWESAIVHLKWRMGQWEWMEVIPIILNEGEPGPNFLATHPGCT